MFLKVKTIWALKRTFQETILFPAEGELGGRRHQAGDLAEGRPREYHLHLLKSPRLMSTQQVKVAALDASTWFNTNAEGDQKGAE